MGIKAVLALNQYEMRWGGGKRLRWGGSAICTVAHTLFVSFAPSLQELKTSRPLRWGHLFRVAQVMPETGKGVLALPRVVRDQVPAQP